MIRHLRISVWGWAAFNKSKFCALPTNGTHTLQVALETLDIARTTR